MLVRKSGIWGTLAVAGLLVSGSAGAEIAASAHDFTQGGAQITTTTMCSACHTPHASIGNSDAPLWDRTASAVTTWTAYTSDTMEHIPGDPAGVSLLCMSCHDGTVALDSFGGATGGITIAAGFIRAADMNNDHPIGFLYNGAIAGDGGLVATATVAAAGVLDTAGNVQCSSCHDVHNDLEAAAGLPQVEFATLCQTCHAK